MKKFIQMAAGLVAASTIVVFALVSGTTQNVATWGGLLALDGVILASILRAKGGGVLLISGYTLGASTMFVMALAGGRWSWGIAETLCSLGVALSLLVWWIRGAHTALITSVSAMVIATVPTILNAWIAPDPSSLWLWGPCALMSGITVLATKDRTVRGLVFPITSTVLQLVVALLVIL